MSPLGLYGALALILLASALVGWALLAASGRPRWSWLAPALGLAVLVVLGLAAQLPGGDVTVSALVAAAVAASVVQLARERPRPGLGGTTWPAVVALVVLLASVPFAAGGGFDVMGTYVNNDLAFHLYNTEWLRSHEGIEPQQVADGYPLGPHGLVLAVSTLTGIALPEVWTGLLMATAVATALASLAVIARLDWPLRTVGALLVGMSYLGAAFYVQSAFKETLMAVFVLGFALALRESAGEGDAEAAEADEPEAGAGRDERRRRLLRAGVAPALFAAAAAAAYGLPGLAWGIGTVVVWYAAGWTLPRLAERRAASTAPIPKGRLIATGAAAIAAVGALGYLAWDRSAEYVGGRDVIGGEALANLFDPLPPSQALGLWLSSDYRVVEVSFLGEGGVFTVLLALLGVAAAGLGVARLARDRELALLSALLVAAGAWVVAGISLGPYVASKSLAIIAPLVMLAAIVGLAPSRSDGDWAWIARTFVAAAFVALALGSSYLALAGARLDRDDHEAQLAQFRDEVEGKHVLFMGSDEYAPWYLRGAAVEAAAGTVPGLYRATAHPFTFSTGERSDFDTYDQETLDEIDYAITPNSDFQSEVPPNFELVGETESYRLYRRTGPTRPSRLTGPEGDLPGAVLDCDTAEGRATSREKGRAHVFTQNPVAAPFGDPHTEDPAGGSFVEWVNEGQAVTRPLELGRGTWELSLMYHSLEPVIVDVPGHLHTELPPNSSRIGPLWPVGTIELDEPAEVQVTVQPQTRPSPRDLLSYERARTGPETILGIVGAFPAGGEREVVPLSEACGRAVDWIALDEAPE
jgi:hypothetical protein